MKISSPTFINGERIPNKYTCDGDRFLSPPLKFEDIPVNTKSLVLIVEDPDVPKEVREDQLFVHWTVFDIPKDTEEVAEGERIGTFGANTKGEPKYTGPCPPSEYQPNEHRYFFKLFALDIVLGLKENATKEEVLSAMDGHILEEATLLGLYKKE